MLQLYHTAGNYQPKFAEVEGGKDLKEKYSFEDFIGIIAQLRSDTGCPWDKVQTHESLRQAMLEEAYEVVDAIDKKDKRNLCE